MDLELAGTWGAFLSTFKWDWFLTLTFADPVCSFSAHRRFVRFSKEIEVAAGRPVAWFRGDDHGRASGRFHIHALMMHVASLNQFAWMARWGKRSGYARIIRYDPSRGAAYYIGRYVARQFSDWDFSDNIEAFRSIENRGR
jgi:hypothetical protein